MEKKSKKINWARQGEILIRRINKEEEYFFRRYKVPAGTVIREGEKSGNRHEVKGSGNLFKPEGAEGFDDMVLEVGEKGAEIKHPEHETVKLPKGKYEIKVQREFDEKKHGKAKD